MLYFFVFWVICVIVVAIFRVVDLPGWLIDLTRLEMAVPLVIGLNFVDWWTTKIYVRTSPDKFEAEANPIARYFMKLGPAYDMAFKLVFTPSLLILLVLINDQASILFIIMVFMLAVLNNSIAILLARRK